MPAAQPLSLEMFPLHLGLGASAEPQPAFEGAMEWYDAYAARTAADGAEGRLVALHHFTQSWTMWEMHPVGAEVVLCIEGELELVQQWPDQRETRVRLRKGEYAVNPAGLWHTANCAGPCAAVFITAGQGTEHRPRETDVARSAVP